MVSSESHWRKNRGRRGSDPGWPVSVFRIRRGPVVAVGVLRANPAVAAVRDEIDVCAARETAPHSCRLLLRAVMRQPSSGPCYVPTAAYPVRDDMNIVCSWHGGLLTPAAALPHRRPSPAPGVQVRWSFAVFADTRCGGPASTRP